MEYVKNYIKIIIKQISSVLFKREDKILQTINRKKKKTGQSSNNAQGLYKKVI